MEDTNQSPKIDTLLDISALPTESELKEAKRIKKIQDEVAKKNAKIERAHDIRKYEEQKKLYEKDAYRIKDYKNIPGIPYMCKISIKYISFICPKQMDDISYTIPEEVPYDKAVGKKLTPSDLVIGLGCDVDTAYTIYKYLVRHLYLPSDAEDRIKWQEDIVKQMKIEETKSAKPVQTQEIQEITVDNIDNISDEELERRLNNK